MGVLLGLLAFLTGTLLLLAIPLTLVYHIRWPEASQNVVTLRWAFGLVRVRIPADRLGDRSGKSSGKGETKTQDEAGRSSDDDRWAFFRVVRRKELRRRIIRFVRDLWHSVYKENVRLHVRIGLDDPADTGQLWAVLGPAAGALGNLRHASIQIEPTFVETTFDVDSSGSLRVIPLQTLYLTAALLLSPGFWRAIRRDA